MRSRWFELGGVDKCVSLLGLAVGCLGILAWVVFIVEAFLSSQVGSSFAIAVLEIFAIVSVLILFPLLSALGILFLPLKAEQRGILSFISLLSSIIAMLPVFFFLWAFYCTATHSICS